LRVPRRRKGREAHWPRKTRAARNLLEVMVTARPLRTCRTSTASSPASAPPPSAGTTSASSSRPTPPWLTREQSSSVSAAKEARIADSTGSGPPASARILVRSSRRDGYGLASTAPTRGARCPTARDAGWVAGPTGIPANGWTSDHQAGCEVASRLVSDTGTPDGLGRLGVSESHDLRRGAGHVRNPVPGRQDGGPRQRAAHVRGEPGAPALPTEWVGTEGGATIWSRATPLALLISR
jgi:hypothetical protein